MLRDRLHRYRGPALVLWGAQDGFVPRTHATAYGEGLSGAAVEFVPGAGHAVQLERPDFVAGRIAAFMNS
jgi:pimeloyl-ACP methyl ester carboxylesterase